MLVIVVPAVMALIYALGHLNWYLGTPLGRVPVLDERENIDFAEAIFGGTLPAAPFYRAPGYALLLAGLRCIGVSPAGLFPAALALGALLHAMGAALAAKLALRWFGRRSALIGGLFFALNPVLVHYATQALDATFALTLFLAGLNCFAGAVATPERQGPWAWSGLFWAAATIARPNYLLVWILVPGFAMSNPGGWRLQGRILVPALAGVLLFGGVSLWQKRVSGVSGFLPWQGAYNLWAANRPGANGRYYTQHVSLPPELARGNPARAESILLYEEETNGAPADIPAMNAHWHQKFLEEISTHTLRWLKLMVRKCYALLNNWEQYNNKTYAFHKALSPWLRFNPLCWGFLFMLAIPGAARLALETPRPAAVLLVLCIACAFSIVLFFASARFRLPLAAICAILAGGALGRPNFWMEGSTGRILVLAVAIVMVGFVTFSHFGWVDDRSTFVQDHALLARAAYTVGDDKTALSEANAALAMQPWHPDAKAIVAAATEDLEKKEHP